MQKHKPIHKKASVLKLQNPEEYDVKFLFLIELTNLITARLGVKEKSFYERINRYTKSHNILNILHYTENGISSFEPVFEKYTTARKTGHMYEVAPYLASLSRILSLIYKHAAAILGKEKTDSIVKESFELAKQKYAKHPDLIGYIPPETMGLSSSSSSSSSFGVVIMDRMIDYLVEEIAAKRTRPKLSKMGEVPKVSSETKRKERVRNVYLEMLGPLGGKQFEKLTRIEQPLILKYIERLSAKSIISSNKADEFRQRIRKIFGGEGR